MSPPWPRIRLVLVVAAALVASGSERAVVALAGGQLEQGFPRIARDRLHMIVLREGTDEGDLPEIKARLARAFRLQWRSEFTDGALIGLLAEMDPAQAAAMHADEAVQSVQKLPPRTSSPPPPEVDGKFRRAVPGWASPGMYVVMLVTDGWSVTFTKWVSPLPWPPPPPRPIPPDWREQDEAKKAAVRKVADELIAAYGGRFDINLAPSSAAFSCAMTEAEALALAADPRVESVGESTFTLLD